MGEAGWKCVGEVGSRGGRLRGACAGRAMGVCGACARPVLEVGVGGVRGACVGGNKCWYRSLRFIIRIPW